MRLFWAMLFVAAVSGCVAQLEEPELPDADRTLEEFVGYGRDICRRYKYLCIQKRKA